ncbi:MAG: hypothetical protein IJ106_09980 [Parasporobacterium sp.]|nr:hypothetical protein [Parasporobacterium sp.]
MMEANMDEVNSGMDFTAHSTTGRHPPKVQKTRKNLQSALFLLDLLFADSDPSYSAQEHLGHIHPGKEEFFWFSAREPSN